MVLAQDGLDAYRLNYTAGDCYLAYLPAPLITTDNTIAWPVTCTIGGVETSCFWDAENVTPADTCGDLGSQDTARIHIDHQKIECVDTDADGQIDFSICLVYDNNKQDLCQTVTDAATGTVAKCGCSRIDLPITPTAVTLAGLEARSSQGYLLGGLGLLLVAGASGSYWLYRKQARKAA